jgi:hypothetical protein
MRLIGLAVGLAVRVLAPLMVQALLAPGRRDHPVRKE